MSIKERMDAFRKGKKNIDDAKQNPVDANAIIIGSFLQGFVPVDTFGPGVTVISTDDIISALADMADISQDDVNRSLATIGYRPGRNDAGSFGWLMKPLDK